MNLFRVLVMLILAAIAHAQTGGDFAIAKFVISNGGATSTHPAGVFSITGTVGQPKAGDNSTGGSFNVRTGFWTPELAPTAANARISGRVTRPSGDGIRSVVVTLQGSTTAEPRVALTSSFGYFVFEDVEVGQTYFVSVSSVKYEFSNPTRVFILLEDLADIDFVTNW